MDTYHARIGPILATPLHLKRTISFTTGGLQSTCRNISRMKNGNRMHLSSISSLTGNGMNTYLNEVFLFFIVNKLANISKKPVFTLSLCCILCRLMKEKMNQNQYWNEAVTGCNRSEYCTVNAI